LNTEKTEINKALKELSDIIDPKIKEVSIILSAGHGKRIKSGKSKMLHEIWGKPSVLRVSEAAIKGLSTQNQIIVVGIKAVEVARALGKRKNRIFVYQEEQRGTGDAVKVAIEDRAMVSFSGNIYVFPGDMGLLTANTVQQLKNNFTVSNCNMLVLTGHYEGKTADNYYGRIIKSKANNSEVIEIKEFKDILAMEDAKKYAVKFKNREEVFSKEELLNIREFNSGVYAFKLTTLKKYINSITPNNVQGEIYVTDLIKIFNDNGLSICSCNVENNNYVVAFNVKSVLKEMEKTFRSMIYDRLKDIITIDDDDDFFMAEELVDQIIELDKTFPALDIRIGKGVYIEKTVTISRGLTIMRNSILTGNINIGDNVTIGENVILSTYPGQTLKIGNNSQIFMGNIIRGSVKIGNNVHIESGVRITGSSEDPVIIGNNVLIKGMTYIFGSIIEDDLLVVHSILKNKYIEKVVKKNGEIQPIKYILPHPEGLDSISSLKEPPV
jgi:bifunctional UDP-N-acetylglucosamine pyrophosphorylase/glucosamine-1-phosphate N-acetyltransferase